MIARQRIAVRRGILAAPDAPGIDGHHPGWKPAPISTALGEDVVVRHRAR